MALVLGVAAVFASACTGSSDSATSGAIANEQGTPGGAAVGDRDPAAPAQEDNARAAESKQINQPGVDRKLVRTATISLAAKEVGEVVEQARGIAGTEGGYAGREEVRAEAATLTLHIPSDRFDRALGELSELGEVVSRDQTAEDVTEQVVDLESRVATQRASVNRVRALLARAGTVEEIVRIEQEVTTREAELESLTQRQQALAGQVAMSTVTIEVSKSATAPPPPPEEEQAGGFIGGLSDGWGAFLAFGGATLRVVGAVLPFLLVLAIPGVPALRWWRRRRTPVPTTPAVQQS
ncbi:DUF4349 domain-containing protein [Actinophytocola sediminis]